MILNPLLDASKESKSISYATLKRLKKCPHSHHLMDVWRLMHPKAREYSFYPNPHKTYSRIDLFLIKHKDLKKS